MTAFIAAIMIVGNFAFSQSKDAVGPIVYDQISDFDLSQSHSYQYSFKATDVDNKDRTTWTADDFTVPASETWEIEYVRVKGYYSSYSGIPTDSVNVFIYSNADTNAVYDNPGDELYSFLNITDVVAVYEVFEYNKAEDLLITLPSTVSLTEGKYWLSVQTVKDYANDNYWGWVNRNADQNDGDPGMYKNPLGGYWYDAPDWTSLEVLQSYWSSWDMAFGLYGPRLTNDLAVVSINTPVSGPSMTATEEVTVTLENPGTSDQSNFDVRFSIDSGTTWTTETITDVLVAATTMDYTFTATADMSNPEIYTVVVEVVLTGDESDANNAVTEEVTNFGVVHIFGEEDVITACGEYFSDPGGPVDPWIAPVAGDTVTLYPEGENQRLWLWFVAFDNGWGDFQAWDGEDVNAPVIDLRPDDWDNTEAFSDDLFEKYIKATNPAGAITISWEGGNYGSEEGWLAEMQCVTPPDDDFWLKDISRDIPLMFANDDVTLSVEVFNYGLNTQSKTVTFTANDTEIGTATTSDLAVGESEIVTIVWTPTVADNYTVVASFPTDGGDDATNNSISFNDDVYAEGFLVESFEGEEFPPEFWTVGPTWSVNDYYADNPVLFKEGANFIEIAYNDTAVTPQLIIADGDSIKFRAMSEQWWFSCLDIYWGPTQVGPWILIDNVPMDSWVNNFEEFSFDISDAAGNNFIAFAFGCGTPGWYLSGRLDFVRGPEIYYHDDNIAIRGLDGNITPEQYDTLNTYDVTVKNIGFNDLADDDYTVSLWMSYDGGDATEIGSATGLALGSLDDMVYSFEYAFQNFGPHTLYAEVDYADDTEPFNNVSDELDVWVQPFGTSLNVHFDTTSTQYYYPFQGNYMGELSEVMYLADSLGGANTITGITYWYYNEGTVPYDSIPVAIYLGETTDTSMEFGWLTTPELALVYEDSADTFIPGTHPHYFHFQTPYTYTGENLVVAVLKNARENYEANLQWLGHNGTAPVANISRRAYDYNYHIDISDSTAIGSLQNYGSLQNHAPKTQFHLNNSGLGEVAGYILDELGNPFEGVLVDLVGYTAEEVTDANGYYKFGVVTADEVSLTATYFGYSDNTDTVEVTEGFQSALDFDMVLKPEVDVIGTVVRSDDNTGVEGLDVVLTGYENYTVQTDVNGDFTLADIYANETYTVTIEMFKFETHVDANVVVTEDADTDLGTIVMQEIFAPSFSVQSAAADAGLDVMWNKPFSGIDSELMIYDDLYWTNSYCADPNEEVMLGNLFNVGGEGSITEISIWAVDNSNITDMELTLKVFNIMEELVVEVPFMMSGGNINEDGYETGEIVIDIPDVAYSEAFYVMVQWPGTQTTQTDWLMFDKGWSEAWAPNVAYVGYPNQAFELMSDLFPGVEGMFVIVPRVINPTDAKVAGSKSLDGYNVYRGLTSDIDNFDTWTAIETVTGSDDIVNYNDATWPPAEAGMYTYAVEAVYADAIATPTFSSTIAYGLYTDITINVASNYEGSIAGTVVGLENTNGNALYSYEIDVAEASTSVNIYMGEYNVTAVLAGYEIWEVIVTLNDTNTVVDILLLEAMLTPYDVVANVDNEVQEVALTWNFGNTVEYIYDDGEAEAAFSIVADGEASLGNLFPVLSVGTIVSVDVYGFEQEGVGSYALDIDFYNADHELLGTSDEFVFNTEEEWTTVTVSDVINFSGAFYAMVHWNESVETDALGVSNNDILGYYYDDEYGWMTFGEASGEDGVFLLRTTVFETGKGLRTIDPLAEVSEKQNVELNTLVSTTFETPVKAAAQTKSFQGFNIYLGEELIATDIVDFNYLISSDLLPEDGTYEAGIATIYQSGVSAMATVEFDYHGNSATVNVQVLSNSNVAIEGASVTIYDETNTYTGITDATGVAVVENVLKADNYTIEASHTDYNTDFMEGVIIAYEVEDISFELIPVSSFEIPEFDKVAVYPNPTKDISVLRNAEGSIVNIYNTSGNLIESFVNVSNAHSIDFSDYKTGTYIIRVQSEEKVHNLKLNLVK